MTLKQPIACVLLSFAMILFLDSCAHPSWLNPEYVLDKFGNLIVSNIEQASLLKKTSGHGVSSVFKFTVKNTGKDPVSIKGEKSEITFRSTKIPLKCIKSLDKSAPFVLAHDATVHVECAISIKADASNQLINRDTVAALNVPYEIAKTQNTIQFKIYLRAEDFK